jgi:hypothetical protein
VSLLLAAPRLRRHARGVATRTGAASFAALALLSNKHGSAKRLTLFATCDSAVPFSGSAALARTAPTAPLDRRGA